MKKLIHHSWQVAVYAIFILFLSQASFAQLSVQLKPSVYNGGYNISCFGAQDASITATVTGGTKPYTFVWSNGDTTQTITDLAAGYYMVKAMDANGIKNQAEITLKEPVELIVDETKYVYPNGYNVSCHSCYNGSIYTTATGGTPPYNFLWGDGPTSSYRNGLGSGNYSLTVTDANGCTITEEYNLTEPERSDWTMNGNANLPSNSFIGSINNQDVVFKTNNTERLRLMGNGDIKMPGLSGDSVSLVLTDITGKLYANKILFPKKKCEGNNNIIAWYQKPNVWNEIFNCYQSFGIGTDHPQAYLEVARGRLRVSCEETDSIPYAYLDIYHDGGNVRIDNHGQGNILFDYENPGKSVVFCSDITRTSNTTYLATNSGGVGIGTTTLGGYKLAVAGKIHCTEVVVEATPWPDYVFDNNYKLMPLNELRAYTLTHKHLPGIPDAKTVSENGVNLGEMNAQLLKKVEELTQYILILNQRIEKLELQNASR
ncbi:MAG: SprB repeat-containing protein [Lentimicrobiaceae bacterium]|nr:SprB repeat-containing protein [Lentimicrobiaceae bacterium]